MDPLFQVHLLNETGKAKANQIAKAFDNLLYALTEVCPSGREMSIVRTKLEEASMFAKKAMALQHWAGRSPATSIEIAATLGVPT